MGYMYKMTKWQLKYQGGCYNIFKIDKEWYNQFLKLQYLYTDDVDIVVIFKVNFLQNMQINGDYSLNITAYVIHL